MKKKRFAIFVIFMIFNGASIFFFPLTSDFITLLVVSAVFGLSGGAFIALTPV